MTTAKIAEEYIKNYFKEKRHIELIKPEKGEHGTKNTPKNRFLGGLVKRKG